MSEANDVDYVTCAVCERRLLPGEHSHLYVTREALERKVCELCRERAEAAGWLLPEEAAEQRSAPTARRGKRQRGELLGGLIGRVERERAEWRRRREERAAAEQERAEGAPAESEPEPQRESEGAAKREAAPKRRGSKSEERGSAAAGLDPAQTLAAFNASEHRRTVAGLTRSLGAPRATAIAVRTASGHPGARLTVAWDLAWYQWEVGPGDRGPEIRQISKGETIDQLRAADRNWNLQVAEDGSLSRRRVSAE